MELYQFMYCFCGRKMETSGFPYYSVITYDEKGNIIYSQCSHGATIIDDRYKEIEKGVEKWGIKRLN